jgi:hypothetical protein
VHGAGGVGLPHRRGQRRGHAAREPRGVGAPVDSVPHDDRRDDARPVDDRAGRSDRFSGAGGADGDAEARASRGRGGDGARLRGVPDGDGRQHDGDHVARGGACGGERGGLVPALHLSGPWRHACAARARSRCRLSRHRHHGRCPDAGVARARPAQPVHAPHAPDHRQRGGGRGGARSAPRRRRRGVGTLQAPAGAARHGAHSARYRVGARDHRAPHPREGGGTRGTTRCAPSTMGRLA